MTRTTALMTAVLLAGWGVSAEARDLRLSIDRFWSDSAATWATVTVRNERAHELVKVDVECNALADDGPGPRAHQPLIRPGEPLAPGASKTLTVVLARGRSPASSVICEARAL